MMQYSFKARQHGQAMVEYAILLILMVTLIMGGLELSVTAYHSKKTGDAAEAGANSWAEAISYSTTSNASSLENQDLLELNRQNLNIDTDQNLANRNEDGSLVTAASCDVLPSNTCPVDSAATSIRPWLDGHCAFNDEYGNFDINLPIDITGCDSTNELQTQGLIDLLNYLNYVADYPSNPQQNFSEVCTSTDNNEGIEKIIVCRLGVNKYGVRGGVVDIYDAQTMPQLTCMSGSPPCPDGIDDDDVLNTTDIYDLDANDNPNPNGNEGGATQTKCETAPSPCPDGVPDVQGQKLADLFSLRGDTDGNGIIDNTNDLYDTNSLGEYKNGSENAFDQTSCNIGTPPCSDGIPDVRGAKIPNDIVDDANSIIDDVDPTFRRLLISKDLTANSTSVPIQNGIIKRRSLGDHNPTNFGRASCNALGANPTPNDYNNGLPDLINIYLFNPLPIDITNCTGNDPFRQNRSRVSILTGGYTDPTPNDANGDQSVEGLPALNQAMYSQYTKVCAIDNAGQISILTTIGPSGGTTLVGLDDCAAAGGAIWLKPPGKMCGAAGGSEICPDTAGVALDLNGATGYYFFGVGNNSGRGQFSWTNDHTGSTAAIFGTFRPVFQIVCSDLDNNSHQSEQTDPNGDCAASGTGSFALEVHTRYRSIFESFLTFGLQELPASAINLANYFYNPSNAGNDGTVLVGALGSELGPLGKNGRPTIKQYKDFRGCFRVDISPPDKIGDQVKTSVSSCN